MSEDINQLNGLTTEAVAAFLECILGLISGMIIAFVYTWKMSLITLGIVPLVALGGVGMAKLQWKSKSTNSYGKPEEDPY